MFIPTVDLSILVTIHPLTSFTATHSCAFNCNNTDIGIVFNYSLSFTPLTIFKNPLTWIVEYHKHQFLFTFSKTFSSRQPFFPQIFLVSFYVSSSPSFTCQNYTAIVVFPQNENIIMLHLHVNHFSHLREQSWGRGSFMIMLWSILLVQNIITSCTIL